jgi:putative transposase
VGRHPHLASPERRDRFATRLRSWCAEADPQLIAWVVLKEHYHLVIHPERPDDLGARIAKLHKDSAAQINGEDGTIGRQVWYEHWDTSLWTQGDLWSRINYVHHNPVNHGYVTDPADWPWSSFRDLLDGWDDEERRLSGRFPAPRKIPGDDY